MPKRKHKIDPTVNWHDVLDHKLTLGDGAGFELVLTADSLLASSNDLSNYSAIGFHAELTFPNQRHEGSNHLEGRHGCYSDLRTFRDNVQKLIGGEIGEASMQMTGLQLDIFKHEKQTQTSHFVEVTVSDRIQSELWPPEGSKKKRRDQLFEDGNKYLFHMVFELELDELTYLQEIDELLRFIESL